MAWWQSNPDDLSATTGTRPDADTTVTTGTVTATQQQLYQTATGTAMLGGASAALNIQPWSTPPEPEVVQILGVEFKADDVKILRKLITAFKEHGLPAVSKEQDMEQAIKEAVRMVNGK